MILLTNTDKGKQLNAALKVEKPFRNNWFASVSYAYGDAKSVIDGTSSQAISNWRFVYVKGDPNHPDLAQSDFDVTHRLNAAFTYRLAFSERWPTNISLFYNAQSGRPYSTTFSNDINGDAQDNDLLFVPRSQSDVLFCVTCSATSLAGELANSALQSAQWAAFDSYVRTDDGLDSSRGKIVDRNASRAPWCICSTSTSIRRFRSRWSTPRSPSTSSTWVT